MELLENISSTAWHLSAVIFFPRLFSRQLNITGLMSTAHNSNL